MKKIKPQKRQEDNVKETMSQKQRIMIAGIAGAVLLLFVILVVVEGVSKSKISIANNTSLNITSIKAYFAGTTYELDQEEEKEENTNRITLRIQHLLRVKNSKLLCLI